MSDLNDLIATNAKLAFNQGVTRENERIVRVLRENLLPDIVDLVTDDAQSEMTPRVLTYLDGIKEGEALALAGLDRLSRAYDVIYDVEELKCEMTLKPAKDFTELMSVIEVAKALIEAEFYVARNNRPEPDLG